MTVSLATKNLLTGAEPALHTCSGTDLGEDRADVSP